MNSQSAPASVVRSRCAVRWADGRWRARLPDDQLSPLGYALNLAMTVATLTQQRRLAWRVPAAWGASSSDGHSAAIIAIEIVAGVQFHH